MKTFACLIPVCLLPFAIEGAELTRAQKDFFEKQIRPILANNCYRCHSEEARSLKASLYLDSKEGFSEVAKVAPQLSLRNPDKAS